MSDHLDKAKAALADASGLDTTDPRYQDLLTIAHVQGTLATAEALTRLADAADQYLAPTVMIAMAPDRRLVTEAQWRLLCHVSDGAWHPGSRTGPVLGSVAHALWRQGLLEREGSSRTASPRNPGYRYRITEQGRQALLPKPLAEVEG